MSLEDQELANLKSRINREPNPLELQIVAAEWSEHCSYKSSKKHLKLLPMDGPLVITEKGYDSGVLDVGDGYVVTVHIESHNHPSAVEPYGGAATGVGGVIRDILSAGTRPVAIFDGLRFGNIENDSQARWLFKNAVKGIADYGNCIGIPTIGGEVEFDECYTNYALVDVAAIGFGKKDRLIKNHADDGDVVVLIGGSTGRDGIGGSQFASDSLESENRSAVQIPDPFIEKLLIEAILEARNEKLIKAMKDLGGGGLSCAISETADALSVGIELDVNKVHTREPGMKPEEIMISESQERMLVITTEEKLQRLEEICDKFNVMCSAIGKVKNDNLMRVKKEDALLADMSAEVVANAPLLNRPSKKPEYLSDIETEPNVETPNDLSDVLAKLIFSPNISSRIWVYGQYDHEVGIRTVVKPGQDASVLRLDNGKFLAAKIDGNPKHCYINPREGAIGCFEEACRNVVCTGAKPIGMVDHLQFGDPEDPEIFWTFLDSLNGLADFAKLFNIPCVGGKVSFYNETPKGPIKPTPLIGVLGLIEGQPLIHKKTLEGDYIVLVGQTKNELGGSEYFEYIQVVGGKTAKVDFADSQKNMDAVFSLIEEKLLKNVHDCSKGGLAVTISELCLRDEIGCVVDLGKVPAINDDDEKKIKPDRLMFSETHSRYVLVVDTDRLNKVKAILNNREVVYDVIGKFGGDKIDFKNDGESLVNLNVKDTYQKWLNSLREMVVHG